MIAARREHRAEARVRRPGCSRPRSVAVVGASRDPRTRRSRRAAQPARRRLRTARSTRSTRTRRARRERAGLPAASTTSPDDVDLAVIAVPADAVADVVDQCARKGVRGARRDVRRVRRDRRRPGGGASARWSRRRAPNGMRVIGPNCLGVVNTDPTVRLNATLRAGAARRAGRVGVLLPVRRARDRHPRAGGPDAGSALSSFVSAGNKADVSGNDLLQYWEDDPATDVVLLYLESFGNPRKFARLARRRRANKPIVAVKSGGVGRRAASARPRIPERAVDALFRQAGVIRVDTLDELFDVALVLATQPLPAGRRVAVVGNSAVLGRLAADASVTNGLKVARLSASTLESLQALAGEAPADNPLLLSAETSPLDFHRALAAVLSDPAVDAVVTIFVPPLREPASAVADVLSALRPDTAKPVVANFPALASFVSGDRYEPLAPGLGDLGEVLSTRRRPVVPVPRGCGRGSGPRCGVRRVAPPARG